MRHLLFGITIDQNTIRVKNARDWEIANKNRWGLYDYETASIKGTARAYFGDTSTYPPLPDEIKTWENMMRADAITDECKKRAKAAYPEYF